MRVAHVIRRSPPDSQVVLRNAQSRFCQRIWHCAPVTPPPTQTKAAAEEKLNRPLRIILLDDLPEVRESIRAIIQAQFPDAEFVECENGDEGWKLKQESPPDLLITDLVHPGLRGDELSARLAEEDCEPPSY